VFLGGQRISLSLPAPFIIAMFFKFSINPVLWLFDFLLLEALF
jgi:hypothetical protein